MHELDGMPVIDAQGSIALNEGCSKASASPSARIALRPLLPPPNKTGGPPGLRRRTHRSLLTRNAMMRTPPGEFSAELRR
jgi:hypothetical protein